MLGWIILLFLAMPFIELYLLIQIGERIGLELTLGLVLATGLLGGLLVRHQGLRAWQDVVQAMRKGKAPGRELAAGALFLAAAAMLLTPGVITDLFGFAMMVPPLRRATAGFLVGRVKASDRVQTQVSMGGFGSGSPPGAGSSARQAHDLETTGYTKESEPADEDESEDAR